MIRSRITEGISFSVWEAVKKAVDIGSADSIYTFIHFFRDIIRDSIEYKKIEPFREYINFPSRIYSLIVQQRRKSVAAQALIDQVADQLSLHLKEVIAYYLMYASKSNDNIGKEKSIELFFYESFNSYNDLMFRQLMNQDWKLLKSSLSRYSQIDDDAYNGANGFEIDREEVENPLNNNEINVRANCWKSFQRNKRQPLTALKYWAFLLFDNGILSEESLNEILNGINRQSYDANKEVDDILFYRTGDLRKYMGWENWDYTERPENELYYPPMPSKWMTAGFIIDRIRTQNAYFNVEKLDPSKLSDVPFLFDAATEEVNHLRNNFEKWKDVLKVETVDDFNLRAKQLLSSIALGKRSVIGEKEKIIAAAPISDEKVENFKAQMGTAWKGQTRVRRIFNYFGNIQDVSNEDVKLKLVGQNIFFEKAKMRFIDGDYYTNIFGMEQLGQNVGRSEDDLFLQAVENAEATVVEGKSLLETLSVCIQNLTNSGANPSMILLEPQFLYKDDNFLKSERYSQHYDGSLNPENINFFVLGTFDQIPIFTSYSRNLKNKVLVSDFVPAFTMLHKTNPEWFENELSVKVLPVTDEQVADKYLKNPEKWKVTDGDLELSEEDAKILIKTSIVIDIETITDFRVNDISKYNIGIITELIPD